jgi:hypothetical protein
LAEISKIFFSETNELTEPKLYMNDHWNVSGHVGWCTASPDTILKLDTLVMIQTKFGFHWSSTFRGEDFCSNLINKAKRQTIEAFSEKSKWKIGD